MIRYLLSVVMLLPLSVADAACYRMADGSIVCTQRTANRIENREQRSSLSDNGGQRVFIATTRTDVSGPRSNRGPTVVTGPLRRTFDTVFSPSRSGILSRIRSNRQSIRSVRTSRSIRAVQSVSSGSSYGGYSTPVQSSSSYGGFALSEASGASYGGYQRRTRKADQDEGPMLEGKKEAKAEIDFQIFKLPTKESEATQAQAIAPSSTTAIAPSSGGLSIAYAPQSQPIAYAPTPSPSMMMAAR